jgi:hypothetical protein
MGPNVIQRRDEICYLLRMVEEAMQAEHAFSSSVTPVSEGQSRVHSICVPGSISTHMLTSQV